MDKKSLEKNFGDFKGLNKKLIDRFVLENEDIILKEFQDYINSFDQFKINQNEKINSIIIN